MVEIDAIHEMADRVKGFLDPEEGERLYEVACEAAGLGPCLEIGSYCGKSALYLGAACQDHGGTLFSVDHHRGSEEQQPGEEYFDPELFNSLAYKIDTMGMFRKTLSMAGLEDVVVPLVCASQVAARAWSMPLSLLFIDGGHAYETVLEDYTLWAKHLCPRGFLLIHDIFEDPAQGGQAPFQIYQKALATGAYQELSRTKTLGVMQVLG